MQKQKSNGLGNALDDRQRLKGTEQEKGQVSLPTIQPASRPPLFHLEAETVPRTDGGGRVGRRKAVLGPGACETVGTFLTIPADATPAARQKEVSVVWGPTLDCSVMVPFSAEEEVPCHGHALLSSHGGTPLFSIQGLWNETRISSYPCVLVSENRE